MHIPAGRVSEIWLPFPDPLPKTRQARHRLVSPMFLRSYRRLLAPGGLVHLKTDNVPLLAFAEQAVQATGGRVLDDLGDTGWNDRLAGVQTTFEERYRREGRAIFDRAFLLDASR